VGHISLQPAVTVLGASVGIGQLLGTVQDAPSPSNPTTVQHAHMAVWDEANCDNGAASYINSDPFSGSRRMQCAPDLYAGGPVNNGQWGKTVLIRPTNAVAMANTPFWDICNSPFRSNIGWLEDQGITTGCVDGTMYCPTSNVLRDQMATFLARAYNYPAAATNYFWDDNGNFHEPDINRIAQAGITSGCGGGMYCPSSPVERWAMVVFLYRAEGLSPSYVNYFDDDNGMWYEPNLNSAYEATILNGCAYSLACPNVLVSREVMAAFIYRALNRCEICL